MFFSIYSREAKQTSKKEKCNLTLKSYYLKKTLKIRIIRNPDCIIAITEERFDRIGNNDFEKYSIFIIEDNF